MQASKSISFILISIKYRLFLFLEYLEVFSSAPATYKIFPFSMYPKVIRLSVLYFLLCGEYDIFPERVLKMLSVSCASHFKLLGLLMSKMMWEI